MIDGEKAKTMRRFFIDPEIVVTKTLLLSKQESHHIQRVVRLTTGDRLQLLDGAGHLHDAEITGLGEQVQLQILSSTYVERDSQCIVVYQSVLKTQNMELLIQKCTELGVRLFTPFYSERTQQKKKELLKIERKYDRWQRIVEEACKQCGTPWAMGIGPLCSFEEMVTHDTKDTEKILFWEEQQTQYSLHTLPSVSEERDVQLVFGPEGGFPQEEIDQAKANGYKILSLGTRILKAETANIAAVSIVQHKLGNM